MIENNFIHPTSIVSPTVKLGENNYIGPFCYITGNTVIGNNNRFEAYCSIGTPPEHMNMFSYTGGETIIGNDNVFREYTSVHSGATQPTLIGNKNHFLHGSHVSHDSTVEDFVNFAGDVVIGGYCYIMEGAKLGLGTVCHQRTKIGGYTMVGMSSVVTKRSVIFPGNVYIGSPAKFLKKNDFGLKNSGITEEHLSQIIERYNSIKIL